MTDSTLPNGSAPDPQETWMATDGKHTNEADEAKLDRSADDAPGGDVPDGEGAGSPGDTQPMTDSTDGGLDGGDPGVEE